MLLIGTGCRKLRAVLVPAISRQWPMGCVKSQEVLLFGIYLGLIGIPPCVTNVNKVLMKSERLSRNVIIKSRKRLALRKCVSKRE